MRPLLVTDADEAAADEGLAHLVEHGGPLHRHPKPYPVAPGPVGGPRVVSAPRNRGRFHRESGHARA